jgi:hypothetical protein
VLKRKNEKISEYLNTIDDDGDSDFGGIDQYNLFTKSSEVKGRRGTGGGQGFRGSEKSPVVVEKKEAKGWLAGILDKLGCGSCTK